MAEIFAAHGDRVALHYASRRAAAEEAFAGLAGSGHVAGAGGCEYARGGGGAGRTRPWTGWAASMCSSTTPPANVAHPLDRTSFEDWQNAWRQVVDVNLLGAAHVSYCAARNMIEREVEGRIVNIGSRGAFRGEPDHPAYGASKAALHAMGQSLAVHLAPYGIGVASVAPGFVGDRAGRGPSHGGRAAAEPVRPGRRAPGRGVRRPLPRLARALWSSGAVLDVNGASHLR